MHAKALARQAIWTSGRGSGPCSVCLNLLALFGLLKLICAYEQSDLD